MKKWECYRDMMQGLLDGMTDALSGLPRSSNANRSHSYGFAYSDGYRSATIGIAVKRDIVGEELAIKADLEGIHEQQAGDGDHDLKGRKDQKIRLVSERVSEDQGA